MSIRTFNPKDLAIPKLHGILLGAVSPRPICFASTINKAGNVNLSPFSFFNVFGANPPLMIFSPARRVRDNTIKHTLENAIETKEVCINIVNYAMVQQMSLSSTEYEKGVNEFIKAGFTMLDSEEIKAPRVKESPVQFECIVKEIIETGKEGGAGNLIVSEVVKIHLDENILDENEKIDPFKIDTVARLGGNWYSRPKLSLFEVEKPIRTKGIGIDALPEQIKNSKILTGNDLGKLGNIEKLPNQAEIDAFINQNPEIKKTLKEKSKAEIHQLAQKYLAKGETLNAWKVLLN